MRPGTTADVVAVRSLLARAYADDPLMRWILGEGAARVDAVAAWLALFVEPAAAGGAARGSSFAGVHHHRWAPARCRPLVTRRSWQLRLWVVPPSSRVDGAVTHRHRTGLSSSGGADPEGGRSGRWLRSVPTAPEHGW